MGGEIVMILVGIGAVALWGAIVAMIEKEDESC